MNEKDNQVRAENNQNTSIKNWLIGGGAVALLGALAAVLTPLPELIESLKPGENEPPVAKVHVIQPESDSHLNDSLKAPIITIPEGVELRLESISSDAQDGSALKHI
ncbi:hypothetical protein VB780_03845 [Leptolyngbya sp. CCNP1308]|uniref:hypothetical protein n=1 Tax=Leptolyngbya sp. CCNP1308 TaxID=3110255 RepID=UPI002B1FDDFE|nr:hypothetical protein [Leptolyngbya sp. CCNP1308]MEA5447688.1 hypothetical protein [Leptolyngbya sp. CCNP1308]